MKRRATVIAKHNFLDEDEDLSNMAWNGDYLHSLKDKKKMSPFQVDSLATIYAGPPRQMAKRNTKSQLNYGVQYLQSIMNDDPTLEGSSVIRDKLEQEKLRDQRRKERKQMLRDLQHMRLEDIESNEEELKFREQIRIQLRKVAENKAKLKESYLEWITPKIEFKEKYTELMAISKPDEWNCNTCGLDNQHLVFVCQYCRKHRHQGENMLGYWELNCSGTSNVLTPGYYLIKQIKSTVRLVELPPRSWCSVIIDCTLSDLNSLNVTILGRQIVGQVSQDTIRWEDGATMSRRETPKQPSEIRAPRTPTPVALLSKTPRDVANQLTQMHISTSTEPILQSMDQNSSVSTQYMGCLALGKLITLKKCQSPPSLSVRDAVIYAMDSHPLSRTIARAGITTLFWFHFMTPGFEINFVLPSLRVVIDTMQTLAFDGAILLTGAQFIGSFATHAGLPLVKFAGGLDALELALKHRRLESLPHLSPIRRLIRELQSVCIEDYDFDVVNVPERLPLRGEFDIPWDDDSFTDTLDRISK